MNTWNPSLYLKLGRKCRFHEDYLDAIVSDGRILAKNNLPVVFSLMHLSKLLDIDYNYLNSIVVRKIDGYRSFRISKRSGGKRTIVVPSEKLMKIQKWINQNLLKHLRPHEASQAYSTGNSPFKNAKKHCGSAWLIKTDLANFFESISESKIFQIFVRAGYSPHFSYQLARICTRCNTRLDKKEGFLPQGAPTSPALANLVCITLDQELNKLASSHKLNYTRYADDIVFSAMDFDRDTSSEIIIEFDKIISKFNLKRNLKKTKVLHPDSRKIVTGLLVNGTNPKLTKDFKNKVRAHLYHARTKGLLSHCKRRKFDSIIGFKNHLEGLINYAVSIEPIYGQKLKSEFARIKWPTI